ncbi:MAG TPA: efflux transporter outer membrane subunit [Steroidobacteraceae bacterium]|nr:efflux transporter outer membrane subunit [Steroidobacteraceae bacterium]
MSARRLAMNLPAALLVAMLAACAVGPQFQRPTAPGSREYAAAVPAQLGGADLAAQQLLPGAAADAQWWHLFASPALDQIVQQALDGNRTLAAAAAAVDQARELVAAREGALAPQVSGSAGTGRQKYGAQFLGSLPKPPPFTYFAIGAKVSYALDYTGGVKRGIEQQRALAEYQQHQLEAAQLAVSGNAVLLALQAASLREEIATVEALLERDQETLRLVQEALAAGSASQLDVLTARSQLATDATQLPALRQQLDAAGDALAVLTGGAPADASLPQPALEQITLPAQLPLAVPSELAHRRPDILAAEAQLHAATAAVGVATGNLYPHLTLTASTGQEAISAGALFAPGSSVWSFAAGLAGPLFDGGTLRAEQRAAVAALRMNAANYQQAVLEAFGQVADALQALQHGVETLQAQTEAGTAASQTADLTRRAYREGEASLLQVLDAERRYRQAQLGLVRARAQRYMDTAQLLLAIGPGAAQ